MSCTPPAAPLDPTAGSAVDRRTRAATRVEVLYFDDCPNHEALVPRLRELLDRTGARADLALRRIASQDDAEREGFLGSPSVRVDGRDVEPAAAGRTDFGLKCRLYATPDGLQGVPPDEWILDAVGEQG